MMPMPRGAAISNKQTFAINGIGYLRPSAQADDETVGAANLNFRFGLRTYRQLRGLQLDGAQTISPDNRSTVAVA